MATIRWYLVNGVDAEGWQALSTTVQTAATCTAGWIVGTGATNSSELAANTERASATFTGNTVPDGTLDTTLKDACRSPTALNGSFPSATWSFQFAVRSPTSGGAADGQIVFRLIKANADGSSPTLITAAQQSASAVTNVANVADANSTLTVNPGAFTISTQYLFVQVAWKRTGAGGNVATNMRLRTGSAATPTGTSILTADFTDLDKAVSGAHRATTLIVRAGATSKDPGRQVFLGSALFSHTTAPGISILDVYGINDVIGAKIQNFVGGTVRQIRVLLAKRGTPTDSVQLTIRTDSVVGTLLATSLNTLSGTAIGDVVPGHPAWFTFEFPAVGLTAGTTYYFVLERPSVEDFSNYFEWWGRTANLDPDLSSQYWEAPSTVTDYPPEMSLVVIDDTRILPTTTTVFGGAIALDGGDQAVTGTTLATGAAVIAGTVAPGAVTTTGATLGSGAIVRAGSVSPGAVTVTGTTLTSTAVARAGTVTTLTAVSGATLSSSLVLRAGTVTTTTSVTGSARASTLAVFPGAVSTTAAAAVGGARVASTAAVFPGALVAVPVAADQPFMWLM